MHDPVNGEVAILWLGASVSPQILNDLFGVDDLADLDARMVRLFLLLLLLSVLPILAPPLTSLFPPFYVYVGLPPSPSNPSLDPTPQHPRTLLHARRPRAFDAHCSTEHGRLRARVWQYARRG
jgi:hypothetical protein